MVVLNIYLPYQPLAKIKRIKQVDYKSLKNNIIATKFYWLRVANYGFIDSFVNEFLTLEPIGL